MILRKGVVIRTIHNYVCIYVTGSAIRYTNTHTMIFLYKCCCSKTRNIFLFIKKKNWGLRYLQLFAYTHAKIEELNVLLTGERSKTGMGEATNKA